jgi:ELWxxDGT repeat protein
MKMKAQISAISGFWRTLLMISLFLGWAGYPGGKVARAQSSADPNPALVRDINQEPAMISTSHIVSMNGALYFSLYNYSSACQLWKSDGSESGTQLIKVINPNGDSFIPGTENSLSSLMRTCSLQHRMLSIALNYGRRTVPSPGRKC